VRAIGATVVLPLLAGAAAVFGVGPTTLHLVVTVVISYVTLIVLFRLRRAWPATADVLRQERPPDRPVATLPELDRIETALLFSQTSRLDFERHLRPVLLTIAASKLQRRGIDAATEPDRAEGVLGQLVWAAITPPAERRDRNAPGIAGEEIEAIVKALEEV